MLRSILSAALTRSHDAARAGDFVSAEREALRALALSPSEPRAVFRLATAQLGLQRFGEAYLSYRHAYELLAAQPSAKRSAREAYFSFMRSAAAMATERGDEAARAAVERVPPLPLASLEEEERDAAAAAASATPVTILSGFLGAGKTTLLRRLLRREAGGERMAVIVNDMAALNVDAELVRRDIGMALESDGGVAVAATDALEVVELSNGCVCCTLRGDLLDAVATLARARDAATGARKWDRIVIEASGISEPLPVAQAFVMQPRLRPGAGAAAMAGTDRASSLLVSLSEIAAIEAMVTVVDASSFERDCASADSLASRGAAATDTDARTIAQLLVDQVEFADVLLLNKCDVASPETVRRVADLLRRLNPRATLLTSRHCENFPLDRIVGTKRFEMRRAVQSAGWRRELLGEHLPETEALGVSSFVYRRPGPFDAARLSALVDGWPVSLEGENLEQVPLDGERGSSGISISKSAKSRVLRSKGFAWIAEDPRFALEFASVGPHCSLKGGAVWKAAAAGKSWDEGRGDRCVEIVFIGIAMRRETIEAVLDAALLAEAPTVDLPPPSCAHALAALPSLRRLARRFAADPRVSGVAKARWGAAAAGAYPTPPVPRLGADPPRDSAQDPQ